MCIAMETMRIRDGDRQGQVISEYMAMIKINVDFQ